MKRFFLIVTFVLVSASAFAQHEDASGLGGSSVIQSISQDSPGIGGSAVIQEISQDVAGIGGSAVLAPLPHGRNRTTIFGANDNWPLVVDERDRCKVVG